MAAGEIPLDWGFAETMAYATLIDGGKKLRLVGQDSGRGTFFHRHAVLHNQVDGSTITPLAGINPELEVVVIDSLLSEEAVLAFEYGYATPHRTPWSSGKASSVTSPTAPRWSLTSSLHRVKPSGGVCAA